MTAPTPSAIRSAIATQLAVAESVLDAKGPSRPAATDLARAAVLKILDDEGGLSRREAAFALGFRARESADALLAKLAAGDFEDHPDLPGKFEGSTAALLSATTTALEPSPL
jgi:hypothetical protein